MIKDNFFDRKSYLDILEKRVTALKDGYRQNIAFIGNEQVGKTAILHKFLDSFLDNRFLLLYLAARQETLLQFCRRFSGVLLYNFLCSTDSSLKEDLDFLLENSQKYIPRTTARIRSILEDAQRRKKENIFGDLMSLTNLIHQETGKFCVVFFDEFQNLESLGVKSLYKEWSQRLMLEKTTMFVITSSTPYKAKAILSADLSLLFGNFEVINVEPFDIRTSAEYLKLRLPNVNLKEEVRNFAVHFTGGYPFYLEVFAQAMGVTAGSGITDTLESMLFASTGILNQKFTNLVGSFRDSQSGKDYLSILHLISGGQNKAKDIAHILKKPVKLVNSRVNYLLSVDVIDRSGDFLKISDRVFGFWLRFVYQEKLNSLSFDSLSQKNLFRKNIDSLVQEFVASCQKPVAERVTEILRLFSDERVQMERKKITLNHFREIKPLDLGGRNLKEGLICRSSDSLWIFGFNPENLSEEDIAEFSRECRKYRSKLQKKVIVTLREVEPNSRLKALEEKVWTWDLNSLNQIMDLFSKPRIIV